MTRGFWMAPRDLGRLIEDRAITPTEVTLVFYVGLHREGERHGVPFQNLDALAALLSCSRKTCSRALAKLSGLKLIRHDLKQGKRQGFRVWLGSAAIATSDKTSDTGAAPSVRSDLGQRQASETVKPLLESAISTDSSSDPRARAGETDTDNTPLSKGEGRRDPHDAEDENIASDVLHYVQKGRAARAREESQQ